MTIKLAAAARRFRLLAICLLALVVVACAGEPAVEEPAAEKGLGDLARTQMTVERLATGTRKTGIARRRP